MSALKDRNVWMFLVINLLIQIGMAVIGPIYVLFVKNYIYDPSLLLIPNLVFHVTKTITEYPTGFLADKYGKKWSAIVGIALLSISFLAYGFGTNIWYFSLAEFIGAFGSSLLSGALDQWLQEKTDPATTTKAQSLSDILGRILSIGFVATLGLFYIPNLSIYWFIAAALLGIALIITLFISKDKIEWHHSSSLLAVKSHWFEFTSNPKLLKMTIYESLRYVVEGAGIFMFWSVLFTEIKGLSVQDMFYVSALIQVGLTAGSLVALKSGLAKSISYTKLLYSKGIILALMLILPNWFAVALFIVYEFTESTMRVKFGDLLNHQVKDSKNGSSLRSLAYFITGLGRAFGMGTMGLVAKFTGVQGLWLFAALVLLALAFSRASNMRIAVFSRLKN